MHPDPQVIAQKAAYQRLLRHPPMIQDLMESLFAERWSDILDFQKAEDASAFCDNQDHDQPQILKVPWRHNNNPPLYVFVFVEPEPSLGITARVLKAISGLYAALVEAEPSRPKLPPVLPILVYCGVRPWDGSEQPLETTLQSYEPRQNLKCLDIYRTDPGQLHQPRGLTALMVQMARSQAKELQVWADDLALHFPSKDDPLQADLLAWWSMLASTPR